MPQHADPDKCSHPCNIINTLLSINSNKNQPNSIDQNTKILLFLLSVLYNNYFLPIGIFNIQKIKTYYMISY